MEDKKDIINSILLANWYLINLQLKENLCKDKKILAKNYLTCKISKALTLEKSKFKALNLKNYI